MRYSKPLPSSERILGLFSYDPATGLLHDKRGKLRMYGLDTGYFGVSIDGCRYLAHRVIWKIIHGRDPIGEVDHVNGCRDDNRPENLRECSSSQNNQNRRMSRRNKSGVKGVYWETARKKWRAVIYPRLIGRFDNLEEAQKALIAARELAHGEFANHGLGQ